MHTMSKKAEAMRRSFHDACKLAVDAVLGSAWSKSEPGPEAWTARFQRGATGVTQVLSLRLAPERHVVEIILAVKRSPNEPMPRVWWEDRTLQPEAGGYAKVLWSGDLTYGTERSISVPREFWHPEFATAIEGQLAAIRGAMETWYAEAESKMSMGDA